MIKRESFFSILIGLFLLTISPLIVHAAPNEIQPVKTGEYHCVSYPGIGTRVLTLFREPDGTVYFVLNGSNVYGKKSTDYRNREGQSCTLAGIFLQEGSRGILDAGSVDFSHPMELRLHHKAPVKIIYHADIAGDEIRSSQEEKDRTGFTEYIRLEGVYKYKQTDKSPVIDRTLALYRVENLPGNAKKAGFDPRKVVETKMNTFADSAYDNTQSWAIEIFTEDRKHYDYCVALNGRHIFKLTGLGLWLIVKDGIPCEGEIPK